MKSILVVILMLLGYFLSAQSNDSGMQESKRILGLDECMKIAMENNIELKRVQNNAMIANANYFQSMMEFLPSVNMNANYDLYNGTFWDQSAARQVTEVTNTANPNISASWTIFNGLNNHHYRNSTLNQRASSIHAIAEQKQLVESNVLGAYLSVVLDKENIKISQGRTDLLKAQLEREKKRDQVGVGNLEQVYNFQSQLANENLRLVNFKNTLMTDMLNLLQVLQLQVSQNYDVAPYQFGEEEHLTEKEEFMSVLESSLGYSPGIKRATANSESAVFDYKRSKSQFYPVITAYSRIGSQYSSNGAINPEDGSFNETASFKDQMTWNKFNYVNLQMTIPVFYNWRNKNTAQVAKLNMENASLDLQQTELDVTNTIQQVYVNLISAQETYKAAEDNLVALNQSFEYVKKRYEGGNTDFYTYLESLNNKNRAEIELVNAKYSIVFRKKILDVYRGLL
ncbi:MAG: TolC family protein [Reichenbachiella sp.]